MRIMIKHSIGLVSVSFRKHSPKEILEAMKRTNLSCIEWGSDVHAPCNDEKKLHELAKLQKEYGIYCCSYGTYLRLGTDKLECLEEYAKAASILGTKILRIWCGDKSRQQYSEDERHKLLKDAKKASEIAQKHDITLCMECHNNTYTETLDGAVELMEYVGSPNFQMYWQPNQFKDFAANAEYAKRISPYVKNVHVFNWLGNDKYPLCEAVETWKKYLACFDEPKTLLLEFMPDGRIESLEKEAKALDVITDK